MMKRPLIFGVIFTVLGTIAAGMTGIVMHEYLHGPFMFVTADPPAADPFRNRHVALGWIATYGMIGFAGGIVSALGIQKKRLIPLALIPVLVIGLLRLIRNLSYLMTEEGRYGIPSAITFGIIGAVLVFTIITRLRAHCEPGTGGNAI